MYLQYFVAASVHVCGRCVDDVAFAVLSDALRLSSSIRSPMNFNRRSPEEFQWKIFLGEDLQALALLAVLCRMGISS